tara:strand:+ start:539 stop:919 length:381 start_codon:yes stop_codon:yes gene_type:complete
MQLKRNTQKKYTATKLPIHPRDAHFMEQLELNPGMSPQDLALKNDIDKAYITRRVRELEQRGFISRSPNPDDHRRVHLALTEAGAEVMTRGLTLMEESEAMVFAKLTEAELLTLYGLLKKCVCDKN